MTVRAIEGADPDAVTCVAAVRVMVLTRAIEDEARRTEVEIVVLDVVRELGSETLPDEAIEEDRWVLFDAAGGAEVEAAVDAMELEVVDVTFELMRSTVLFPVIDGGCQRISQDSALMDEGAVVHIRSAPSQTVKPFWVAFPWLTRAPRKDAACALMTNASLWRPSWTAKCRREKMK